MTKSFIQYALEGEKLQKKSVQSIRDGFKKKKKLMEFSIKGPDPASQPLNGKKIK